MCIDFRFSIACFFMLRCKMCFELLNFVGILKQNYCIRCLMDVFIMWRQIHIQFEYVKWFRLRMSRRFESFNVNKISARHS